jgi:hypothetical protein
MGSPLGFETIPFELRALGRWVLWRYDDLRPNGKRAKVPYRRNGKHAKVNDSATWSLFEAVKAAYLNPFNAFDGVGFVMTAEDGLVGIDLDDCVNADGSLTPLAQRLVALLRTYWEYSPSGRGLRAFIKGSLPQHYGAGLNRTAPSGERIEAYQHGHYLTLTGAHLPATPRTIEPLQDTLDALLTRELPTSSTGGGSMNEHPFFYDPQRSYRLGDYASPPPVDDGGDDPIIRRLTDRLGAPFCAPFYDGNIEAYGGDESKADFGLLCSIARECGLDRQLLDRLYRKSELYTRPGRAAKWDARHSADGRTYGEMTIAKVIAAVASSSVRPNGNQPWKIESARAIVERGVPPLEWDIEELLTRDDGPALFFAPPGSLKSWLGLHLCICKLTGTPFLGHFPVRQRSHAIYINLDAGANAFSRRLTRVSPPNNLLIVNASQYDPTEFENVFHSYPGAFVVVDCLADVGGGVPLRGEDPSQAARRYFRELRALYERYDANGVVMDHPHRPRDGAFDYYGSIQKEATVRAMWMASLIDDDEGSQTVKITCRKQNEAERFKPFVAAVDFRAPLVRFEFRGYLSKATGQRSQGPSDVERVASVLHGVPGGLTCKRIMELVGLPRDRVLAALKDRRFGSTGRAKAIRYTLLELHEAPGDSPFDSDVGPAESNGLSETLGEPEI